MLKELLDSCSGIWKKGEVTDMKELPGSSLSFSSFTAETIDETIFSALAVAVYQIRQSSAFGISVTEKTGEEYIVPLVLEGKTVADIKSTLLLCKNSENELCREKMYLEKTDIFIDFSGRKEVNDRASIYLCVDKEAESFNIVYDSAIIRKGMAESFKSHFEVALNNLLESEDYDIPVDDVNVLSEEEYNFVKYRNNETDHEYPDKDCIHTLFERLYRNDKYKDKLAITSTASSMTIGEFINCYDHITAKLQEIGVGLNDYVVILARRCPKGVAAMYGVWKAGAATVPVSLLYPPQRIAYIIKNCGAKAVLTTENISSENLGLPVININEIDLDIDVNIAPSNATPDTTASLIYTSGTTGDPKGVRISHRTVVNYCTFNKSFIKDTDTITQFTPYTFSTCIYEINSTLLIGARMAIVSDEEIMNVKLYLDFVVREKANLLLLPPSYANILPFFPEHVRIVETGSSASSTEIVRKTEAAGAKYFNAYGLTEGSVPLVWSTREATEPLPERVPIGTPVFNSKAYVMRGNKLCGTYMEGELCVTGLCLSQGYFGLDELNEKKFVDNPFGEGKMLRTGDNVIIREDGVFEYIGREDDQVKIRGMRVELVEIEKAIRNVPSVREAAVKVQKTSTGENCLVAFYATVDDVPLDESNVISSIKEKLVDYMIPSYYRQVKDFPMNLNRKIDRRKLPDIEIKSVSLSRELTDEEKHFCGIVSRVMKLENVSPADNFIMLGGNSLTASLLLSKIVKEYGVSLPIRTVFEAETIGDILNAVKNADPSESEYHITINKAKDMPYYIASPQQMQQFMAAKADNSGISYHLPSSMLFEGNLDIEKYKSAWTKLIERHEILRTTFELKDENVVQVIHDPFEPKIECITFDQPYTSESEHEFFDGIVQHMMLEELPLFRIKVVYFKDNKTLIINDIHHIISDGYSMQLIKNELFALYNGIELPDTDYQYKDYSEWLRTLDMSEHQNYWKERIKDVHNFDLVHDKNRPPVQRMVGKVAERNMESEFCRKIDYIAAENGTSRYIVFMSAAIILLSKYSIQDEVVLGTPFLGRTEPEFSEIVGFFANSQTIIENVDPKISFREHLKRIKAQIEELDHHQIYPFGSVVQNAVLQKDVSRSPLFSVILGSYESQRDNIQLNGLKMISTYEMITTYDFDICLDISPSDNGIKLQFEYSTDLFNDSTGNSLVDDYIKILEQISENNDIRISDILSLNNEIIDIPEKYEKYSEDLQSNFIIYDNDVIVDYEQISRKASQIRNDVISSGLETGSTVALPNEMSWMWIASVIGIMSAGMKVFPINPCLNPFKLEKLIDESECSALLIYNERNDKLDDVIEVAENSEIDIINSYNLSESDEKICLNASAGIIEVAGNLKKEYSLAEMIPDIDCIKAYGTINTRFTVPLSCPYSIYIVLCAFFSGGSISISNSENIDTIFYIDEQFIDAMNTDSRSFNDVRRIVVGGRDIPEYYYKDCKQKYPELELLYGFTSDDLCSIHGVMNFIENDDLYVISAQNRWGVKRDGRECDENVVGLLYDRYNSIEHEIYAKKLTDDKIRLISFISNVHEKNNTIWYERKIKDLILSNSDAKRVELIAKKDKTIAVLISDKEISDTEISKEASKYIPAVLMPDGFIVCNKAKTDIMGKVQDLSIDDYIEPKVVSSVPVSNTEKRVYDLFRSILGVDNFDCKLTFFELGGNSLKAVRLTSEIREVFNCRIPYQLLFENATVSGISTRIESGEFFEENVVVGKIPKQEWYDMSSVQKRIYLTSEMDESGVMYNIPVLLRLDGILDVDRLRKALSEVINAHESLRTEFRKKNGQVVQYVLDHVETDLEIIETEDSVDDIKLNYVRPIDLGRAPLCHMAYIIDRTNNRSYLIIDIHHIICDGISMLIFQKELLKAYKGEILVPNEIHVKEYNAYFNKLDISERRLFWNDYLDGYQSTRIMPDYVRNNFSASDGKQISINTTGIAQKVKKMAKILNCTEYNIYASVFMILLGKYTNQTDVIMGSVVSGRSIKEIAESIGMYVNTIILRAYPSPEKRIIDYFNENNNSLANVFDNQDYPFEKLIEDQSNYGSSASEIFNVMFAYQNNGEPDYSIGDVKITSIEEIVSDTAKFDISFVINQVGDEIRIDLEYKTALYKEDTIRRIITHYCKILEECIGNHELTIGELNMITDKEKICILNDFNATATEYPRDKTVVELFEEQVKRTPDNIALVFEEKQLTYAELNARANSLAHKLRELGVKSDDFVAIIADKSIEIIEGIYGIIKAGGAYLPIDPTYPEDRIAFMLEDSSAKIVLKFTEEPLNIPETLTVIDLADETVWNGSSSDPESVNKPEDAIYCIYTSGTTGKPKGVVVEHHNVVKLVMNCDYTELNEESVILQTGQLMFDASTFEVWGAALNGGTLHLISKENMLNAATFKNYLIDNKVNTLFITTALFNQFIGEDKTIFNSLKHLMFGGEATSERHVEMLRSQDTDVDFRNVYGPTETTTFAAHYIIKEKVDKTPIGKPISNTQMYVLNGNKLCGIGVPGELCIAGDGVARGYLNRPELNAEKFVKNPFGEGKMYRSGDLVRWLSDGNIEFLGRIDEQVKIHGFRIELGEIETRIRDIENIRDCVAIVKTDNTGDKAIYAYYTGTEKVEITEIRSKLAENMPEYMVPAYMMQLEELPVTKNGKIDKRALPEIEARATREYVAPRNGIEEKICAVFSEILNVEQVGIKDSFLELGGNSLKAIKMIQSLEKEAGIKISIKDVFVEPTPENLSKISNVTDHVYAVAPLEKYENSYEMTSVEKRLFAIHKLDTKSLNYNIPVAFEVKGDIDVDRLRKALVRLVNDNLILRTTFEYSNGAAIQRIHEGFVPEINVITVNENNLKGSFNKFVKPFDLSSLPLFRITYVKSGDDKKYLFADFSHIIADGISTFVFFKELFNIYNNNYTKPVLQYVDYGLYMQNKDFSNEKKYWNDLLRDEITAIDLPFKKERADSNFEGRTLSIHLDKKLSDSIKKYTASKNISEYMFFISAFFIILSKYSGQEDIIIGTPAWGRTLPEFSEMLGMFVNTVPVRAYPSKDKKVVSFIEEIKEYCMNMQKYQEYPLEMMLDDLQSNGESVNQLFNIMFTMQDAEVLSMDMNGIRLDYAELYDNRIAKFDLSVDVLSRSEGYLLFFESRTSAFDEEDIKMFIENYAEVISSIISNDEVKILDVQCISQTQKKQVLDDYNDTFRKYTDKTAIELFEDQVEKTPEKTALLFNDSSLSYAEFNKKANKLAHMLRELGIGVNDYVAVIAERSIEMYISIYAIVKADAAYVPIDPHYPDDRIDYIISDASPKAVITYNYTGVSEFNCPIIDLANADTSKYSEMNPEHKADKETPVYAIYTSGTTGTPKGVINVNKGLVNRILWMDKEYPINENDVVLQKTTFTFDVSVWEIFWWGWKGATLAIPKPGHEKNPENLCYDINNYKVTTMHFVPSMLDAFLTFLKYSDHYSKLLETLRYVFASGEKLALQHVHDFYDIIGIAASKVQLINVYGPTEASIDVTYYPCKREDQKVPIGKPIDNIQIYIVNEGNLCAAGMKGELCIAGTGLAKGYINKPELTAEKFTDNPFGSGKMYHTGDVAVWNKNGEIEYLGRIDDQVKIRGFRIELGDIEDNLRNIQDIDQVAVITKKNKRGENDIFAYYTSRKEIPASDIRNSLLRALPDYMVPAYIMQISEIPMTSNGKLNRRALPDIELDLNDTYVAPRNEFETVLANVMAEVLGVERVGINDDFYILGGNSIRAIKLISIMKDKGYDMSLDTLLLKRNIKDISASMLDTSDLAHLWKALSASNVVFTKSNSKIISASSTITVSSDITEKIFGYAENEDIPVSGYIASRIAYFFKNRAEILVLGYAMKISDPSDEERYCYDMRSVKINGSSDDIMSQLIASKDISCYEVNNNQKTVALIYDDMNNSSNDIICDYMKIADTVIHVKLKNLKLYLNIYSETEIPEGLTESVLIPAYNRLPDHSECIREYLNLYESNVATSKVTSRMEITPMMKLCYDIGIRFSFDIIDIKSTPGMLSKVKDTWNTVIDKCHELYSCINIDKNSIEYHDVSDKTALKMIDLSYLSGNALDLALLDVAKTLNIYMSAESYNGRHPSSNAVLVKLDSLNYKIFIGITHLIFDQQSREILNDRFKQAYEKGMDINFGSFTGYGKYIDMIPSDDIITEKFSSINRIITGKEYIERIDKFRAFDCAFDLSAYDITAADIYNISLLVYQYCIKKLELSETPVAVISSGRKYIDRSFMDVVGECIDLVPIIVQKDTILKQEIETTLNRAENEGVNYSRYFYSAGITAEKMKRFFVFNYLGMFSEFNIDGLDYDEEYPFVTVAGFAGKTIKFMNLPVDPSENISEVINDLIKDYLNNR